MPQKIFEPPDEALALAMRLGALCGNQNTIYDAAATIREVLAPEDIATLEVLINVAAERVSERRSMA